MIIREVTNLRGNGEWTQEEVQEEKWKKCKCSTDMKFSK